jgi:phosphoserine phosphatase
VPLILLTRHGHVDGIKPERFRGRAELALTEVGQSQARLLAQRIASNWTPNAVYCSPLQRCVETGAAIANACGIELQPLGELNDLDYGKWQSKTHEEGRADNPVLFATWFAAPQLVRFPDGEALQDVAARTAGVLRFMLRRHNADTVVLVGHDSVNRVLLTQLLDMPLSSYWRFAQHPCCVNVIEMTSNSVQLQRLNDTAHLANRTRGSFGCFCPRNHTPTKGRFRQL